MIGGTVVLFCFNPRARDGREPPARGEPNALQCFNPRARDGRELKLRDDRLAKAVSIHAPVMDAKS